MSVQSRQTNNGLANSAGHLGLILLPIRVLVDIFNSVKKPETRKSMLILLSSIFVSCFLCSGVATVISTTGGSVSTSVPTYDMSAMQTQAVINAWAPYTQTAEALPTSTFTSTIEPSPTYTASPTNTPDPTWTPQPTETNTAVPTATGIFIPPTTIPSSGGSGGTKFDNNGDGKVTCADFNYQYEAQEAYRAGHTRLDGNDNDGLACESLR